MGERTLFLHSGDTNLISLLLLTWNTTLAPEKKKKKNLKSFFQKFYQEQEH